MHYCAQKNRGLVRGCPKGKKSPRYIRKTTKNPLPEECYKKRENIKRKREAVNDRRKREVSGQNGIVGFSALYRVCKVTSSLWNFGGQIAGVFIVHCKTYMYGRPLWHMEIVTEQSLLRFSSTRFFCLRNTIKLWLSKRELQCKSMSRRRMEFDLQNCRRVASAFRQYGTCI